MALLTEAKAVWPWSKITPITSQDDNEGKGKGEGEPGEGGEPGEPDESDPKQKDKKNNDKQNEPKEEEGPRKVTPDDIDNNARRIQDQMSKSKDHAPDQRPQPKQGDTTPGSQAGSGGPGGGRDPRGHEVDYSKIRPTFNWSTLLKRFIMSASNKTEETYSKPSRRGVSGLDVMRQVGAAAIKPAEKPLEFNEAKLCFVFDVSGSMDVHNAKVFSNAISLLKQPQFKATEVGICKFSDNFYLFKVNFARNKGQSVSTLIDKPNQWTMTAQQVVGFQVSGGTTVTAKMVEELATVLKAKWNIIIFSDRDILHGANYTRLAELIKAFPRQVSVIFDSHGTYVQFRAQFGGATPLISHF